MHLILWRHAEAEHDLPDASRRLTAGGRRDAQRVGAWLDVHLPREARIVVSPAQRALETARALRREFETDGAVGPGRSADELLALAQWPDARTAVLIVGHQPTLGVVAARLGGGPVDGHRIDPAGLWWLVSRGPGAAEVRAVLGPDLL